MRRARKIMDRAAREAGLPRPLVDFHTGQIETSPTTVGYLGHFPYADRKCSSSLLVLCWILNTAAAQASGTAKALVPSFQALPMAG